MPQNKVELTPYRPLEIMLDDKVTKSSFNDFIAVWPGFVPKPWCERLIKYGDAILNEEIAVTTPKNIEEALPPNSRPFEIMSGSDMYAGNLNRNDSSFLINYTSQEWIIQVNQFLKSCLLHYITNYSQLTKLGLMSSDLKFQRTSPGGGYHLWHYENSSYHYAQREIAWMIYLNDITGGGETEFLYQKRRIVPTVGTVVMWPAAYTHVHRGNTVLTEQDKYIVTGWYQKTGEV